MQFTPDILRAIDLAIESVDETLNDIFDSIANDLAEAEARRKAESAREDDNA